jgi:hypothetical protein
MNNFTGKEIPDSYFQKAGAKMKTKATIDLPDDYITLTLRGVGLKPSRIKAIRPRLEGLSPDTVQKVVREANARYDRDKFPDCSGMIVHLIEKRGIKPVPQVEKEERTTDINKVAFWDVRIRLFQPFYKEDLFMRFGKERLLRAVEKVRPYYWEDMPGPTTGDKMDQAEAQKMPYGDFCKLVEQSE